MKKNTTNFELNPVVFTAEYITTHLLPVIRRPSADDTLAKEQFLDLELFYKVVLKDSDTGLMTYRLTKALADSLHLDMEFLKDCAILNNLQNITCESMAEIFGLPDSMMDMYVISNVSRNLGAGTAFICTLKLKELAKKWRVNDIIILPSSIHELIAVRADIADADYINQMIREINVGIVSEEDQLSDHFYVYHTDSDSFTY